MESTPADRASRPAAPPPADGTALAGRTVLVTGAAGGIGRACALAFAAAGAHVHVVDRAAEGAKAVAEEVGGTAFVVDLADPDAVDQLPDDDVVVDNAGLQHIAPVQDFPVDPFVLIQKVMVEAPFRIIRRTCRTCTGRAGAGSSTSPRCTTPTRQTVRTARPRSDPAVRR